MMSGKEKQKFFRKFAWINKNFDLNSKTDIITLHCHTSTPILSHGHMLQLLLNIKMINLCQSISVQFCCFICYKASCVQSVNGLGYCNRPKLITMYGILTSKYLCTVLSLYLLQSLLRTKCKWLRIFNVISVLSL